MFNIIYASVSSENLNKKWPGKVYVKYWTCFNVISNTFPKLSISLAVSDINIMRHTLLMLNYLIFSEVFWIYNLLNWRSIVMLSTYDSPYTCIVVSLSKTWLDLMFTQTWLDLMFTKFVDFFSLDMPAKYYFLRLFCIECF